MVGKLAKSLRFRDLVIMGLIFIGPAAPVNLSGVLDAISSGAVSLVYVVATLVMAFTAYSYAKMSQAVPSAGSVYAYASAGINPKVGFLVGWIILLDYLFIPAVAYLFTGISLNAILPGIPIWLWTILAVVITTTLNIIGLKRSMKVTFTFLILEVVILIAILVIGVFYLSSHGTSRPWLSPFVSVSTLHWSPIFTGVSIAVLSYLGFDAIATFSEENVGSRNIIGKAMITCLIFAGVIFVIQTFIGVLLSPYSVDYLRAHPEVQGKAFFDMVHANISPTLDYCLALIKAIGAAFSAMVGQAASGRLIFSMARDGRLPKKLSKVGTHSGVPTVALVSAAIVNMILAVIAALAPDGLSHLVSFVNVGALVAFIMLHVSVIGYFYIKGRLRSFKHMIAYIIVPIIGIIVLLPVLVNVSHLAQLAGLIWLIIGVIVLFVTKKTSIPLDEKSQVH